MNTIKFEILKRKAIWEFVERLTGAGNFPTDAQFLAMFAGLSTVPKQKPLTVLKEWEDYGVGLIEAWDIRCAMKLAELFPTCLPNHLRGRKPDLDYDERGNWVLIFP